MPTPLSGLKTWLIEVKHPLNPDAPMVVLAVEEDVAAMVKIEFGAQATFRVLMSGSTEDGQVAIILASDLKAAL